MHQIVTTLSHSFSVLLSVVSYARATASLTSTGCADAPGMDKCAAAVSATLSQCLSEANGNTVEILGCGCGQYINNYNCYSTHCWNRVFECEYQLYIVEYFGECSIAKLPVPYYPAPDAAPDSCSCNLGQVLNGIEASIDQALPCEKNDASIVGVDAITAADAACQCCALSGAISSIYNFCPTTDPSLIGISAVSGFETTLNRPFSSCSTSLAQVDCASNLGYNAAAVGGSFLKPENLPPSGTATLTNLLGKVTAPASGTVFSYTNGGDGQVYTISAANVPPQGASGQIGGSGSGSGSGSTSGAGAGTVKISVAVKAVSHPGFSPLSLIVLYGVLSWVLTL